MTDDRADDPAALSGPGRTWLGPRMRVALTALTAGGSANLNEALRLAREIGQRSLA